MLRLLKIRGDSLTPEYQNGDFVVISKIPFLFAPPTCGDVIAFQQPGYGLMIKRIQQITPDGRIEAIGSHPESVDSRVFGTVKKENVLGKVIWHIHKV